MSKRFLMFMIALLTIGVQAFAQTTISGKVTDTAGGAVIGAAVQVKGTTTGAWTDLDGAYSIAVKPGATLVFSAVGYSNQEVVVGSQKTIDVVLAEDAQFLDDVVVIGYGTARKKDVSGAIQSMSFTKDKNAASLPNPNALSALSSKIAGFSYAPTSSASGDNTSSMTIRGMNTIPTSNSASNQSVNKPLLIVDGVLSYDSINSINTSDIESIDVLKDASAAAIYGSRAANGVIIITTKRGQSGKPQVSFNSSVSFSDWANLPARVMDDKTFLENRFYAKQAVGSDFTAADTFSMDDAVVQKLLNPTEYEVYKNGGEKINWVREISRLGVGQKYDVSVAGRSKAASYYVSGNYTRQQGILVGDDYEKMTVLSKVDVTVNDWLTVGLKANYLGGHSWGQTAAIQNAMAVSPYSYRYSRVEGFETWHNSQPDGNITSPLIGGSSNSSLYTDKSSKSSNLNGVAYAQIDFPFLKGLQYKVTLQGQRNFGASDSFVNAKAWVNTANKDQLSNPSQFNKNATGSSSSSWSTYWNIDNILTYNKDFGKNHVDVMAGYTSEHTNSEGLGTSFTGFTVPTTLGVYIQDKVIYDDAAGSSYRISRTRTESSSIGILARLNYNFANTYYVSANFRRDGYSAFAPGHKWGNFYGASAAWVLSNEEFVKNASWINFLKLRASWGQNGSRSVSPYITAATVNKVVGNSGAQTSAWLGGKSAMGITATNLANSALTWATINKTDIGLDFSLFEGRVGGSIDGYWGKTTDMLLPRSVPYISGFSSTYDNAGLVTNNGVEFVLNTVNVAGDGRDGFRWESSLVVDHNSNTVKQLYGPGADGTEANDVANYLVTPESQYALIIGKPITAAYGMKKLGIFNSQDEIDNYKNDKGELLMPNAQPGDLKFADTNNDGKVDTNDYTYLGCSDPLFTLNFGNTFSWKGFSLYFNLRWAQGDATHFLGLDPYSYTVGASGSQLAAVKPWTENNHSQVYPRYGYSNTYNYQYWTPRSFLKLKDLTFSYTLSEKAVKAIGVSAMRVYVAGTDLFTISKWTGIDPETGGTQPSGASSDRYTANSKGTFKTCSLGVNITF